MFLCPTDTVEVSHFIGNLKSKKSEGHAGISTWLIQQLADVLCEPLNILITKSLCNGEVPDALKIAKIIPILYKAKDKQKVENHRPISILPALSKIEKKVLKRLYNF